MSEGERRLAAVMFTDMVGYTALTQSNETLALSLLQTQSGILLPLIRAHRGVPIKTIGDAHLAEFESALEAVLCAVEIQEQLEEYNRKTSPEQNLRLRIGIHVGDVVHQGNDVFGDAVNIASRIEPLAEPGGICLSQQVYDQVQNKVKFKLEKLPFHQLKNVSSRIEVYKVIDTKPDLVFPEQDMPKERVAVLPLSNFSPSRQDEYLADGMTEELITAISGVEGLRVIARTSVMRFKNKEVDIREIGSTLNAGTILEGSFRKIGERIRVTVQLIDARTEEHRWAQNYDGDMKDIFSIQTDIAGKVAQALQRKLLEGPRPSQGSVNIEAYELYMKGRHYWNRRTADGVSQALKLFNAAIEKDPRFAKAHAGVADCYLIGYSLQLFKVREEAEKQTEAAILKAIELDNTIAEAYASHGLLLNNQGKYLEAVQAFERALSLNPSYATAHHWYSICLANLGKLDGAIEEAKLASQADPLSPPARNILGAMYVYAREYDKAIEVFDDILKLEPDFPPSLSFRSNVFAYRGMEEESMRDMIQSLRNATDYDRNTSLAYNYGWFGHKEEAAEYFEKAKKDAPSKEALTNLNCGYYACLGDKDGFFSWASRAIDQKALDPEDVRYAPWIDKMREDPRYEDLLKSLPE